MSVKISALVAGVDANLTAAAVLPVTDATGTTVKATLAQLGKQVRGSGGVLSAKDYGAIADGSSHPLSSVYGSLGAAQAVYPFVTSLTQQLDWAACQLMSNTALGWNGAEHGNANRALNIPMILPGGSYQFGADTWLIRNAVSAKIEGAGRLATTLTGSGTVFATDGLWYSQISGIAFVSTGAAAVVVDIDGNVPGHPYATTSVQGNTFRDLYVDGSTVALLGFAMTRLGNPGGGAQGSENLFLACHFNGCVTANYFQTGFNALQNTFIGGNFQGHQKHGMQIIQGFVALFSVGFQSTYGYQQIVNGGYDISAAGGGINDRIQVIGCRTESLRFYSGNQFQPPFIEGCYQTVGSPFVTTWSAAGTFTLNQFVFQTSPTKGRKMYRVTTAGTSAGAPPTWPDTGTVADGTVVWTETDYEVITTPSAEIRACDFDRAGFIALGAMLDARTVEITASYTALFDDELILCANTGDITVTIPQFNNVANNNRVQGKRYIVKKVLNNAGKITVTYGGGALDGAPTSAVIPGGTFGTLTLETGGTGTAPSLGYIISKSFERVGTALVAGDFALSAGFGTTASVSVATKSSDSRGTTTVTSAGTGQAANPTLTLTFKDGTYPAAPFAVACRSGGSQPTVPVSVTTTATTMVVTFLGTPVAAETYTLSWTVTA